MNTYKKICLLLGIIQCQDRLSKWPKYRFNKYNPLTWMLIAAVVPVMVIITGIKEIKGELKDIFKYN